VPDTNLTDLYAIKIGAIWREVKQQHISFWALTGYFFFEYVRPQSIYPAFDVLPWSKITLLVAFGAVFMDRSVKWVSSSENVLFMLFILVVVLSSVFAFEPSVSWEQKILIINWLLVYFLFINIVNSEKRLLIFVLGYLLFSFKMSQHGFFSFANRGFSFTRWGLSGPGGFFANSGEFAIQMIVFGTLSLAFALALRGNWGRYKVWFFYFMPFSAFMSVIGSSSRGAQLALAAVGVVYMLKLRVGIKYLLTFVLLSVVLINFLPEEQMERFSNIGEDKTSRQRLIYFTYGIGVMNDNPVLGLGYYNWGQYIGFMQPREFKGRAEEPHNIFIKVGAELGYTGLICFLLITIFVFIINSRTRRAAKKQGNKFFLYLAHGLDAGFVGYLVAGFFVTVVYYPFFWVQMAMTVALNSITNNQLRNFEVAEDSEIISDHSAKRV